MLVYTNGKVNLAALRCCAANSLEQWCELLGWHQTEENNISTELPTYSIVRDPLPRFAHGFTEKMIKMWTGNNQFNKPTEYFVMESAVARLSDSALIELISSILKEPWRINWTDDQHIRLQSDWLGIFKYLTLIKIDELNTLPDLFGVQEPIPKHPATHNNFINHLIDLSAEVCSLDTGVLEFIEPDNTFLDQYDYYP